MRSRAEMYQANAEACRHQATLRDDASEKCRCLVLAEQWAQMAEAARKQRREKRYFPKLLRRRETRVRNTAAHSP
jgi:hypothetical protein